MTDHNDTGATARPPLTKTQFEILEECAGIRSPRLWGAAVGACLESLRGYGFIERNGKVTSAGATAIINAYEPLKVRLAEVEREHDEAGRAWSGLMQAKEAFRAEAHRNAARALAAEVRIAVLEKVLRNAKSSLIAFGGDPRATMREFGDQVQISLLDEIDAALVEQKEAGK